jgi:hypothetical protein
MTVWNSMEDTNRIAIALYAEDGEISSVLREALEENGCTVVECSQYSSEGHPENGPTDIPLERALQRVDIQAIVISRRNASAVVKQALFAGKHVLVYGYLLEELHEFKELRGIAATVERIFLFGSGIETHPSTRMLQELISQGELGALNYIFCDRRISKSVPDETFALAETIALLAVVGQVAPDHILSVPPGPGNQAVNFLQFDNGLRAHVFIGVEGPDRLVVSGAKRSALLKQKPFGVDLFLFNDRFEDGDPIPHLPETELVRIPVQNRSPAFFLCEGFVNACRGETKDILSEDQSDLILKALSRLSANSLNA